MTALVFPGMIARPAGAANTDAVFSPGAISTIAPSRVTGVAVVPGGQGMWRVALDGRVFSSGTAPALGSARWKTHDGIIAIAATKTGKGFWLTDKIGRVFAFGDATLHGSLPGRGIKPSTSIAGFAASPSGKGYWLVAADGRVYAFGDAVFRGSAGFGVPLAHPVVGIAPTGTGNGYWLAASDGGIFRFGDAGNHGSLVGKLLAAPIVDISASAGGNGYRMAAADGGVFTFGDATFFGSAAPACPASQTVAITRAPQVRGYWLTLRNGRTIAFSPSAKRLPACPTTVELVSSGGFYCPIAGRVTFTDTWGTPRSNGRTHKGQDLFNAEGTPNVAVLSGRVWFQADPAGGNAAYLEADDGNTYYYAHLSAFVGGPRRVSAGETIGKTGRTGNIDSWDPTHTHFEKRLGGPNGERVNPYSVLVGACKPVTYT